MTGYRNWRDAIQSYDMNAAGQVVARIKSPHQHRRPGHISSPRVLWVHTTEGVDSRQELFDGPRGVSSHYLIGRYGGENPIQVYQLVDDYSVAYTQGNAVLGGLRSNPNDTGLSMEIEGPPVDDELLRESATLAAVLVHRWQMRTGVHLVIMPHWLGDAAKKDPTLNWNRFQSWLWTEYEQLTKVHR